MLSSVQLYFIVGFGFGVSLTIGIILLVALMIR
jgi:hypothetical protein